MAFVKNIAYMYLGIALRMGISLVTVGVYFRLLGPAQYAFLGLVYSLFGIASRFDFPSYLSLLKNRKGTRNFGRTFNNLLSLVYISSIAYTLIILPITIMLAGVHGKSTFPLYLIGILIFLADRIVIFHSSFLRANGLEAPIQKSIAVSIAAEVALTLLFILHFKLGVISILIASLCSRIIQGLIIAKYSSKLVNYKPQIDLKVISKIVRQATAQDYIMSLLTGTILWGGLFIMSFYLEPVQLGILTIFVTILDKLQESTLPLGVHYNPIIVKIAPSKKDLKELLSRTFAAYSSAVFIGLLAVALIGDIAYYSIFGEKVLGTYGLLMVVLSFRLLVIPTLPLSSHLYIKNIVILNKINLVSAIMFFGILLYTRSFNGMILAYCASLTLKVIPTWYIYRDIITGRNAYLWMLNLGALILCLSLSLYGKPNYSVIMFGAACIAFTAVEARQIISHLKYLLSL